VARAVRALTPVRIAGALAGLIVAAAVVLWLVPSNDFLLLPDGAHPVAPLVSVQGGHNPTGPGGIYFVDVFERRASMLESLFPFIRSGSTLVPASELVPPGVSDAAQRRADLREMSISERVAAAVALAGRHRGGLSAGHGHQGSHGDGTDAGTALRPDLCGGDFP